MQTDNRRTRRRFFLVTTVACLTIVINSYVGLRSGDVGGSLGGLDEQVAVISLAPGMLLGGNIHGGGGQMHRLGTSSSSSDPGSSGRAYVGGSMLQLGANLALPGSPREHLIEDRCATRCFRRSTLRATAKHQTHLARRLTVPLTERSRCGAARGLHGGEHRAPRTRARRLDHHETLEVACAPCA